MNQPVSASANDGASFVPSYTLSAQETLAHFQSDLHSGLNDEAVQHVREREGFNELKVERPPSRWIKLAAQFRELVVLILLAAAVISGIIGDWVDTLVILAIVLLNGLLGFFQEEKAQRAISALQSLSAPFAKVIRNGELRSLPARELVSGDIITLEAGDHVPADARLVSAYSVQVQEAPLTGESVSVEKNAEVVLPLEAPLGDRRNMVYLGTAVSSGKGLAVVVATGMQTELGRIAGLLQLHELQETPLQRRLGELGRVLIWVCLAIVSIIFALQIAQGSDVLTVSLVAVSLAVAAVPEGLPAVVTVALAIGLQRMVKRNALVRKLPSVETLGSVTVICTDKTGTLTRNEMTVRELMVAGVHYEVTGSGYTADGKIIRTDGESPLVPQQIDSDLLRALEIGAKCNNSTLVMEGKGELTWRIIGDPTEGALLVAARKIGIEFDSLPHNIIYELPFDSERKAMSVVLRSATGKHLMFSKGAPESILGKSVAELRGGVEVPLSDRCRHDIERTYAEMAARAMRVLAVAYRELPSSEPDTFQESDLVFVGLVGMIDPPREEVKVAVHKCQIAGIRPIMITGDHPATAIAIARELKIANEASRVMSGTDLDRLSDEELTQDVNQVSVYARVTAQHKLRIVNAWKARGAVVAMTGDGVNDAPAVKAADIGIAMGITGTDVTKDASDMVLTDDNFASIINAIEEGRGIFDNIQKFVHYLLACNAGEVLLMFVAALLNWPIPLLAIQILWINLVTDGLPALALAMEPTEADIMNRQPRPPYKPVITWARGTLILVHGALIAAVSLTAFWMTYGGNDEQLAHARTVSFCVAAYSQLFFSLSCRSHRDTMPQLGPLSNPYLLGAIAISALLQFCVVTLPLTQPIFQSSIQWPGDWQLVLLLSCLPVTLVELAKLARAGLGPKEPRTSSLAP